MTIRSLKRKVYNAFANLSIRGKIVFVFVPILLSFVLIVTLIWALMTDSLQNQIIANHQLMLEIIRQEIQRETSSLILASERLMSAQAAQRYLLSDMNFDNYESLLKRIRLLFNREASSMLPSAVGVWLLKEPDDYVAAGDSRFSAPERREILEVFHERYIDTLGGRFISSPNTNFRRTGIFHYVASVHGTQPFPHPPCLLVVNLNNRFLLNIFRLYSAEPGAIRSSVYRVYDFENNLIAAYCRDKKPSESPVDIGTVGFADMDQTVQGWQVRNINGRKFLHIYQTVHNLDWKLSVHIPLDDVMAGSRIYQMVLIIAILLAFLLFLLLLRLTTRVIVSRISEMAGTMSRISSGEIERRFPVVYGDEISRLGNDFNIMLDRLQYLTINVAKLNLRQREAELAALQSQINPHFLYNTLETIRMSAIEAEADSIAEQIKTLADIFRYTVVPGGLKDLVPIRAELEHVRDYIRIQRYRFGDRHAMEIDVAPEIYELYTLRLILQPLVENAYQHGIRQMRSGGHITLHGRIDGEEVIFTVSDNGRGMSEARLAELRADLSRSPLTRPSLPSIGLVNVNDRLRLAFGDKYHLKLDSHEAVGTTVSLNIPVLTTDEYFAKGRTENDEAVE